MGNSKRGSSPPLSRHTWIHTVLYVGRPTDRCTHQKINTCNLCSPLTLFFSPSLAHSVNKPAPSDASSGCGIVWGALHCSGAVRARKRQSLCRCRYEAVGTAVIEMRCMSLTGGTIC